MVISILSIGRGLLGLLTLLGIAYLFSANRRRINWRLIGVGFLVEFMLAFLLSEVPFLRQAIEWIGKVFVKLLSFSSEGVTFLLGPYGDKANGYSFLFHGLSAIIFFSALVSLLYHLGVIQFVVRGISKVLRKLFNVSGPEGTVLVGNVFLGMTEVTILVDKYIPKMNKSEIFMLMVVGMGTISGTVMGIYILMVGGDDAVLRLETSRYLISGSLLAIPGSVILAKMVHPQTEVVTSDLIQIPRKSTPDSTFIDAITEGAIRGVKLIGVVGAIMIAFIALIALFNFILKDGVGQLLGINDWIVSSTQGKAEGLTFQYIVGLLFSPIMWLIGVPSSDSLLVGSLLGIKTITNEFIAFQQLHDWTTLSLFTTLKGRVMSIYMLANFANVGSIGILVGVLGVLAPEKKALYAHLAVEALLVATLVSLLTATIEGMFIV